MDYNKHKIDNLMIYSTKHIAGINCANLLNKNQNNCR